MRSRSVWVSTCFGVNWARGETNETVGRNGAVWQRVEDDPAGGTHRQLGGLRAGQKERHVDITEVDHGSDLSASGKRFADIGGAKENTPQFRRDERRISDHMLEAFLL